MFGELRIGGIIRARSWTHHIGTTRLNYGVGRQKKGQETVAVMLYLGNEPLDESKPQLDLEKRMNDMGWYKTP
jgi:hypothetical protein